MDIIISPTGKRLEIFAHDSAYTEHPLRHVVQATIQRSWDAPQEPDGPFRKFGVVYLTSDEMEAWLACHRAAEAHAREIRENLTRPVRAWDNGAGLRPGQARKRPGGPRRRRY
jgi:hypothetical protein